MAGLVLPPLLSLLRTSLAIWIFLPPPLFTPFRLEPPIGLTSLKVGEQGISMRFMRVIGSHSVNKILKITERNVAKFRIDHKMYLFPEQKGGKVILNKARE